MDCRITAGWQDAPPQWPSIPPTAPANTVYGGGAFGGVWKSQNAGTLSPNPSSVTWTTLTDNQPTLTVGSIAIQPQLSSPNAANSVILVGTGETNSSGASYYGLGILRSANAGNGWVLISQEAAGTRSFAGLGFSKIAFSTVNPDLVVAAAAGASEGVVEGLEDPVITNRELYYSTDAGQSWNYALVKDAGLVIDPSSAASVVYNATAGQFLQRYSGTASIPRMTEPIGVASTTSQADSVRSRVPPTPRTPGCPLYRGEFAVVPGRNEMYFWYVDGNSTDQLIWQTKDGGSTWTQLNDMASPPAATCRAAVEPRKVSTTWSSRQFPMEWQQTSMPGR